MKLLSRLLVCGILVAGAPVLRAQTATSLRQTWRSLQSDPVIRAFPIPDTGTIKCGTPYVLAARMHWSALAPQSRDRLSQLFIRIEMQKNRLSPSGRFRIHYDTVGANQPALIASGLDVPNSYEAYVDSVAAILDYVWTFEIDTLGYAPPLPDGIQGGGPEYDVYIESLGGGVFGYTDWDPNDPGSISNGANARYPTFMTIDKDFLGLRTPGMNGLRVTCAHEFHHAIQIGGYGMWTNVPDNDFYFNELTSSWMEDVVYTQVNDYYFDVVNYFQRFRDASGYPLSFAYYSLGSFAGYERCIWGHFLARRFGRNFMREIWTGIRTAAFLQSARAAFARHGSDWSTEFSLFTYWNYFTADRADTVRFYPEGNHYPRFIPNFSTDFSGNSSVITSGAYALSSSMLEFRLPMNRDTITAIVSNTDVGAVLAMDNTPRSVEVELTKGLLSIPHVTLANGFTVGIGTNDRSQWRVYYTHTDSLSLSSGKFDIAKINLQPSPNPFHMSEASELMLPLSGSTATVADVSFLTSSLSLAYSGAFSVRNQFGNQYIAVPASALQSRLNSGVYFIIAKLSDSEYRWKVAVIR